MPRKWHHFTAAEVVGLDETLVAMLDKARALAHIPFIITSGFRDPAANTNAGGVKNSAHEYGLAVDIRAKTPEAKEKIRTALRHAGFVRIGMYSDHIHCDIDRRKPQVAWAGGKSHA